MTDHLLAALRRHTNERGLIVVGEKTLLRELRVSATELRAAVQSLAQQHAITLVSPLPFLIGRWSGHRSESTKNGRKPGSGAERYSFHSSLSTSRIVKESYRPNDEEALLQEILATLGETDPTTFRGALRSYSPAVIRTALERIRKMPRIRKSPTAVFRFLLPRIAQAPRFKN